MTPVLARIWRGEPAFERLYRRHVADVYRYALVVLHDPCDAEQVTRITFLSAYCKLASGERPRDQRFWLLGLAHVACRRQARLENAEEAEPAGDDAPTPADGREGAMGCHAAERAISRQVDGRLGRPERKPLRRHLRECPGCADFARSQRARRSAWKALGRVRPPDSLQCFMAPAA